MGQWESKYSDYVVLNVLATCNLRGLHAALDQYQRCTERRIVLIGKTGTGKSTVGNAILGKKIFKTNILSMESTTLSCEVGKTYISDKKIVVVDTPGVMDTSREHEQVLEELFKCTAILAPGPHAFCLVIRADVRFTDEETKALKIFSDFYGEAIYSHLLVVFTHKSVLDKNNKTAEDCLLKLPMAFLEKYRQFKGRCIAIETEGRTKHAKKEITKLLSLVEEVIARNNGNFYTDRNIKEAEKVYRARFSKIKEKMEKQFEQKREARPSKEIKCISFRTVLEKIIEDRDMAREEAAYSKRLITMARDVTTNDASLAFEYAERRMAHVIGTIGGWLGAQEGSFDTDKDISPVEIMLAILSTKNPLQMTEATTRTFLENQTKKYGRGNMQSDFEAILSKDSSPMALREDVFKMLFREHGSDLFNYLQSQKDDDEIIESSNRYILKIDDIPEKEKEMFLKISATKLKVKLGDECCSVWVGKNYRDKKGGEVSLVCFHASNLQDKPQTYLGFPVLYRASNKIEHEPLEICLNEEYRHTSITTREREIKNLLLEHYGNHLFQTHSNLEAVSASSVISSRSRGLVKSPSIVLFCRFKGVIPIGEHPFPTELRDSEVVLPTDVREGFFTLGMNRGHTTPRPTDYQNVLKMGCSIGREGIDLAGTLGPFLKDNEGNIGFLTCAHVVGIDTESTVNQTVVQPADSDNMLPRRHIGKVMHVVFNPQQQTGVDAAVVQLDSLPRRFDPVGFVWNDTMNLTTAGFTPARPPSFQGGDVKMNLSFDDVVGKDVIKCGRTTGLKVGSLALDNGMVRIHDSQLRFPPPPGCHGIAT